MVIIPLGQLLHADILTRKLLATLDRHQRGKLLGHIGAAWRGHGLNPGGAVDVAAEKVLTPENFVQVRIHRPGMQAQTRRGICR